ncbi:MAG: exo-alpha-sialidase [Clostridia bacterium]|nr:exo-alpha-sialidase [Clostridia bacterium]
MIKVIKTKQSEAVKGQGIVSYFREYLEPEGLRCKQIQSVQAESDYVYTSQYRLSEDNGKTYGDWMPIEAESFSVEYGEDEMLYDPCPRVWNPHHNHWVVSGFYRYFIGGHKAAYKEFWATGARTFFDHQSIALYREGEKEPFSDHMIMFEDGKEFDPQNPRDKEYLEKNNGFQNPVIILKNGDIALPVSIPVSVGCKMAGLDVNRVFPSSPELHSCIIVAVGKYNQETEQYDFTFSNPVILDDLRSSRGICEPILAELESGRILLVMRGSNVINPKWNTRIEEGTPSFKWFAYSDDRGKTFTDVYPWHFDDREVIYSGATISALRRSSKNGKLYWFGNISDHTAYVNFPRFPLYVAQVDDKTGFLKKETLTMVDTRRDGELDCVQLSNFTLMEDRETLNFELTLGKIGQFDAQMKFYGEGWHYEIDVDA